jgi:hypothetical protein
LNRASIKRQRDEHLKVKGELETITTKTNRTKNGLTRVKTKKLQMAVRSGSVVTFRSHHGNYICAEKDNRMVADRQSAAEWESFSIVAPQKYIGADIFYGDRVQLRTHHGKYLCAEPNFTLVGDRSDPKEWETFTLVHPFNPYDSSPILNGQQVAFRTHHGRYICAEPNGRLVADRTEVKEWERFTINVLSVPVVNFGDRIKLKHIATNHVLHSHNLFYSTGSGQQQVTCFAQRNDDDWWEVQSVNGQQGPVPYGTPVLFRHVTTGAFLHSHANILSPVTHQQEVTCFRGRDSNDNWTINPVNYGGSNVLTAGVPIIITHLNTNRRLHSHPERFYLDATNFQQEVTCYHIPDQNDHWRVIEIAGRYYKE